MATPESALQRAREEAARRVAAGGYAEAADALEVEPTQRVTLERLLRYAVVEPDLDGVRSTRPGVLGKTVTAIKRGLVRSLRQYNGQVLAQQMRFNIHAVAYITALEDRIESLEAELEKSRNA